MDPISSANAGSVAPLTTSQPTSTGANAPGSARATDGAGVAAGQAGPYASPSPTAGQAEIPEAPGGAPDHALGQEVLDRAYAAMTELENELKGIDPTSPATPWASSAPKLDGVMPSDSAASASARQSRRSVPSESVRPVTSERPGIPSCRAPPGSTTRTATTGAPSIRRTRTDGVPLTTAAPPARTPDRSRRGRARRRSRPTDRANARPRRGCSPGSRRRPRPAGVRAVRDRREWRRCRPPPPVRGSAPARAPSRRRRSGARVRARCPKPVRGGAGAAPHAAGSRPFRSPCRAADRSRYLRTTRSRSTYFGFFTPATLERQEGLRAGRPDAFSPAPETVLESGFTFPPEPPLTPEDPRRRPASGLAFPAAALRMIDRIDFFMPEAGPRQLGFIQGSKEVHPQDWFFQAHFFQDPVWPGSLGLESFLQLLKFAARQRWPQLAGTHRFAPAIGRDHRWTYRGQILPVNRRVTVEAAITEIVAAPHPAIFAEGYLLVDGLPIYRLEDFGVRLLPAHDSETRKASILE